MDYNLSDIRAATAGNDRGGMFGGDNDFLLIIVLFFFMMFGGGFGGGYGANGALTRAEMQQGFDTQEVVRKLDGITNGLSDGFYAQNTTMLRGFADITTAVREGQFMAKDCCCETNRNIDASRYEMSKGLGEIASAIHTEGEITRALINANTMQDLRDKLEARDRDILARDFQLSQLSQTASLVSELRPCAKPAYITCSPYTTAGTCGAFGI